MGGVGRPSSVLRRCAVASPWPWVGGGCARSNHRRIRGMPVGSAGQPWERRPATRGFAVVAECLLRSRGREKDGRSVGRPAFRLEGRWPEFSARATSNAVSTRRARNAIVLEDGIADGEDVHAHASSGPWMRAMGNHGVSQASIPFFPFSFFFFFPRFFFSLPRIISRMEIVRALGFWMSVCACVCVRSCAYGCVVRMLSTGGHRWHCGGYIIVVRARFFLSTNRFDELCVVESL